MVLGYLYGQKSTPKAYFQYIILTKMNPIIHCAMFVLKRRAKILNECLLLVWHTFWRSVLTEDFIHEKSPRRIISGTCAMFSNIAALTHMW